MIEGWSCFELHKFRIFSIKYCVLMMAVKFNPKVFIMLNQEKKFVVLKAVFLRFIYFNQKVRKNLTESKLA